jgi:hypothetical protein
MTASQIAGQPHVDLERRGLSTFQHKAVAVEGLLEGGYFRGVIVHAVTSIVLSASNATQWDKQNQRVNHS